MTTDSAKPAVITAAQFVADGYAERIAAGECVVTLNGCKAEYGHFVGNAAYNVRFFGDEEQLGVFDVVCDGGTWMRVQWLPVAASSTDADEVARLRAEVARLREKATRWRNALEVIVNNADTYQSSVKEPVSDYYRGVIDGRNAAVYIARAALDATGEAQS